MTVKRWSTGPDHSVKHKATHVTVQTRDSRAVRLSNGFRIASVDDIDDLMASWPADMKCVPCASLGKDVVWNVAIYVRLNGCLYVFPTCRAKACQNLLRSDAIHDSPHIN